jgi:hypothetical protein
MLARNMLLARLADSAASLERRSSASDAFSSASDDRRSASTPAPGDLLRQLAVPVEEREQDQRRHRHDLPHQGVVDARQDLLRVPLGVDRVALVGRHRGQALVDQAGQLRPVFADRHRLGVVAVRRGRRHRQIGQAHFPDQKTGVDQVAHVGVGLSVGHGAQRVLRPVHFRDLDIRVVRLELARHEIAFFRGDGLALQAVEPTDEGAVFARVDRPGHPQIILGQGEILFPLGRAVHGQEQIEMAALFLDIPHRFRPTEAIGHVFDREAETLGDGVEVIDRHARRDRFGEHVGRPVADPDPHRVLGVQPAPLGLGERERRLGAFLRPDAADIALGDRQAILGGNRRQRLVDDRVQFRPILADA